MSRKRIPGVLKITINDEDHPDDPDKWTIEEIERMEQLSGKEPFVICRLLTVPMFFSDNKIGQCAGCGRGIQYRPNNEITVKVCDLCADDWIIRYAQAS